MRCAPTVGLVSVCSFFVGLAVVAQGCGGGGSPAAPSAAQKKSVVTGTMTVTAEYSPQGGINYITTITLRETGGLAATINNSVIEQLMKAGTPYESAQQMNNAWPLNPSSNTLPANGSLVSNPLYAWDQKPDGVASQVDARVDFADQNNNAGNIHIVADVPATVNPAPAVSRLTTGMDWTPPRPTP